MTNTFNWQREPGAEAVILDFLNASENPFIKELKESLRKTCSTGLIEWVDHIGVPLQKKNGIEKAGFKEIAPQVYRHPGAQLPDIVIDKERIALHVDSIADFLSIRGLHKEIEGVPFSQFRKATIFDDVWIVERRGALIPVPDDKEKLKDYFAAKEKWMTRSRSLESEELDFNNAETACDQMVALLGQDQAACLVLECERAYWQARNLAGQIQKNRQDRLGMGWANHDHHTFRSSRKHFAKLVRLFEKLGFHCRERYYTGAEAGWGAQIMENPRSKLVLFLDVDLHAGEIEIDFAHETLPEKEKLGTIGLWCALHGDSILKGGMHHLEAQFSFQDLKEDLSHLGIRMMDPFSDFPYLKQAFTQGEVWVVDPDRINTLLKEGKISKEEAEKFATHGAIGSHMENLQRKEGYKGFNQKNVSTIIKKTDPRKN